MPYRLRSLVLALMVSLAMGACHNTPSSDGAASNEGQSVHVSDFRLVKTSGGQRQVMGTLHNDTGQSIGTVQVEVSLFDANNVRIETMSVTVSDIPANGDRPFKKPLPTDATVQGARVRSVLLM